MRELLPPISEVPWTVLVATPFMLLLFVGIVWWVYRKDRKGIYDHVKEIPLQSDNDEKGSLVI